MTAGLIPSGDVPRGEVAGLWRELSFSLYNYLSRWTEAAMRFIFRKSLKGACAHSEAPPTSRQALSSCKNCPVTLWTGLTSAPSSKFRSTQNLRMQLYLISLFKVIRWLRNSRLLILNLFSSWLLCFVLNRLRLLFGCGFWSLGPVLHLFFSKTHAPHTFFS